MIEKVVKYYRNKPITNNVKFAKNVLKHGVSKARNINALGHAKRDAALVGGGLVVGSILARKRKKKNGK